MVQGPDIGPLLRRLLVDGGYVWHADTGLWRHPLTMRAILGLVVERMTPDALRAWIIGGVGPAR